MPSQLAANRLRRARWRGLRTHEFESRILRHLTRETLLLRGSRKERFGSLAQLSSQLVSGTAFRSVRGRLRTATDGPIAVTIGGSCQEGGRRRGREQTGSLSGLG